MPPGDARGREEQGRDAARVSDTALLQACLQAPQLHVGREPALLLSRLHRGDHPCHARHLSQRSPRE